MSLLTSASAVNNGNNIWATLPLPSTITTKVLNTSSINVSSLVAEIATFNKIYANSTFTNSLNASYIETLEQYVDDKLTLDTQVLTANATQLLLNGVPLATISNLSSIADWSLSPQISTLNGNNQNIIGTNILQAKTIGVSTLGVSNATITTLVGNNGTFVNLFTQNLMAFNIVNFTSTVIEVYESTIQSDIKLANISTANISNLIANNANFDVLIVSSIAINNSTINTAFLNVGSNANIQTATFSNGASFNGTRPNFNTGINTTGPNNFNNCNIDNASNINGAIINVSVGGQTNITADAGNNILGNPAINLTTQGGGTSAIRIYANECSPVAFPIPNSSVDIIAKGNVSYIPIAPIPYGGIITMTARAGGANPLTSPLSMLAGNGAIRLQADSYIPFGSLYPPIPGVIALSGGAVLSFSGLTIPTTGPYGCSFYSALTALSLTCGASPALTSFPGTVYLRGDNGTKVLNGLYVDTLYNSIGVDLNITTQSGNWVNIDKAQSIRMSNSGLLDGGGSGSKICNVENITASNITTPQLNVGNISTNAITLPQLYTSQINIAPSNTVFTSAPNLTINANATTDEFGDPEINNLNLIASSNINITIPNNNAYSINMSGNVYVSKNLYITSNVEANGAVIGAGGINMNSNDINNVKNIDFLAGLIATGSNFLDINGGGLGTFTSMKSGDTYYTIDTAGNPTVNALSTNQVALRQTAGSDFILFNNGDTRMRAVRNAYMESVDDAFLIAGKNIDIRTVSSQNITIQQTGAGNQSYIQLGSGGNTVLNSRSYIELLSQQGSNGIYLTGSFTECRGYLTFNTSNNRIQNVGHIYGDTSAPGGGLAIDYMYGLFFNSSGKNANLYIDSGNLNMINYNSGINIANYNSNGTGNISIYSASNEVLLATGNGRNIAINSGSNIYLNAGGSDGLVAVYTSTMNTYTLQDTNITAQRNMTLNSSSNTSINSVIDTNITAQKNMTLSASNSGNYITLNSGQVNRTLSGASIAQPVIQYGEDTTTSGGSGSVVINLPVAYTAINSYVAFASMEDSSPSEISVVRNSASQITIYWAQAGSGTHSIAWNTMGT